MQSDLETDDLALESEPVKVLATLFKNEKECSRKIYTVHSAEHLINKTMSEQPGFAFDRVQKHNSDFQEFVDVDRNVEIKNFDRFQIFISSAKALPQTNAGEACQIQHVPVPDEQGGLQSLLNSKTPEVLEEHKRTGTLKTESRRHLVKVLISHLVEKHGFYPPSAEKLALAKGIITTFPSSRVQIDGNGDGYEHFYDPSSHSGFLEMRLRNIRRKLEAGQPRYTKCKKGCDTALDTGARSEQDQGESSETGEWITLMKRLRPSSENIPSIKSAMENTYTRRRAWISKATPTLTEIFNEYPRFLDMPNLMDIEFGKITAGKTDQFIRKWEASIIPKLRAVAALEKGGVASLTEGMEDQTDDEKCYTMLVVLTHLLPPMPGSRCSVKSAITFLIDFVPPGTSIASLCDNSEMASRTQPQLICMLVDYG
ncbi:uncharacterized protein LOC121706515 isoform X2 [Alosa sapidissima]|nr:uncharacterized protein LOC121706515 isoform X2 [Alosa sapidissima]XP_041944286.1 uncharacterized protein LOC121706515 isoform X2 [Alosa sapidissima]